MYLHLLSALIIAPILCSPAFADENGSIKYFVRNSEREAPPKPSTLLRSKDIRSKTPMDEGGNIAAEDAAKAAWTNYKAFASGKTPSATATAKIVTPKRPTKPAVKAPAAKSDSSAPPTQTGIAGLLQQYQDKQSKRSQMNTLNIRKPVETTEKAE